MIFSKVYSSGNKLGMRKLKLQFTSDENLFRKADRQSTADNSAPRNPSIAKKNDHP